VLPHSSSSGASSAAALLAAVHALAHRVPFPFANQATPEVTVLPVPQSSRHRKPTARMIAVVPPGHEPSGDGHRGCLTFAGLPRQFVRRSLGERGEAGGLGVANHDVALQPSRHAPGGDPPRHHHQQADEQAKHRGREDRQRHGHETTGEPEEVQGDGVLVGQLS